MKTVVAYCGILCSDCPTFKATKMNDDGEGRRIAKLWTRQYGKEFRMEDINCDGCLSRGQRVFSHCNICEVRKRVRQRNVESCAYCEEYACEKLSQILDSYEPAREVLDRMRISAEKRDVH